MSIVSKVSTCFSVGTIVVLMALLFSNHQEHFGNPAHHSVTNDVMQTEQSWHLRSSIDAFGEPVVAIPQVPAHPPVPSSPIRTALLICHLLALVVAMGSALFLDAFLFTRLYKAPLDLATFKLLQFGGRLVELGLAGLWLSGLGFMIFYWADAPDALSNQKLWAKVVVVCCLTLNGLLIHQRVMPKMRDRIGRPILAGMGMREAGIFLGSAALSCASWVFAFILGIVKELNFAFSAPVILLVYASLFSGIFFVLMLFHRLKSREISEHFATDRKKFVPRHGYRLAN
jgi:hypothetical protein